MTGYTVIWLARAESELASLWLTSDSRNELREAVNRFDRRLSTDPLGTGESRDGSERSDFEAGLAIIYDVNEADRLVAVGHIWRPGRIR